jgi:hypothetical protein
MYLVIKSCIDVYKNLLISLKLQEVGLGIKTLNQWSYKKPAVHIALRALFSLATTIQIVQTQVRISLRWKEI